jgi:hypothetical protein
MAWKFTNFGTWTLTFEGRGGERDVNYPSESAPELVVSPSGKYAVVWQKESPFCEWFGLKEQDWRGTPAQCPTPLFTTRRQCYFHGDRENKAFIAWSADETAAAVHTKWQHFTVIDLPSGVVRHETKFPGEFLGEFVQLSADVWLCLGWLWNPINCEFAVSISRLVAGADTVPFLAVCCRTPSGKPAYVDNYPGSVVDATSFRDGGGRKFILKEVKEKTVEFVAADVAADDDDAET